MLIGFNGNDTLEGGAGADQLFGSDGLDLASYKSSPEDVTVNLADLYAAGGDAEGDTLSSIEGVIGSAYGDLLLGSDQRDVFRGEAGNDFLVAGAGNDQLDGGGGNDTLNGGTGNDELLGGSGSDTAYFGGGTGFVVADLASGTASGSLAVGSDRLAGVENLEGTIYNDRLAGGAGANRLAGGEGVDELAGRGGADRFAYHYTEDSLPTTQDRILDFSRAQKDKIDLADVDANEQASGEQAFRFVGQGPFTAAGQLRFFQQDGDTIVEANTTDATAGAEMRIVLDPLVSLQGSDFVL